jgi:hypothetical protein
MWRKLQLAASASADVRRIGQKEKSQTEVRATTQSLYEKALGSAIGRRNRLPHHGKPNAYRTVGQALSPVNSLWSSMMPPRGANYPSPNNQFRGTEMVMFR